MVFGEATELFKGSDDKLLSDTSVTCVNVCVLLKLNKSAERCLANSLFFSYSLLSVALNKSHLGKESIFHCHSHGVVRSVYFIVFDVTRGN